MALLPVPNGSIAAVVTHLEMFAPPAVTPPPPRSGLSLEHKPQPQKDWYLRLYRDVGEEWLWASRLVITDKQLLTIIQAPTTAIYAVLDGNREIGLVELNWQDAPDCEIVFFGLIADATGGGIGRWLMGQVQRLVFAEGAKRLWLHTCTLDDPAALPFYLAQGFRAFRREIEIIPDPRLSGEIPKAAAGFCPVIPRS